MYNFEIYCVYVLSSSVVYDSLQHHGLYSTRLFGPCNFPGENTGVGCHFLLQGVFPTRDQTHVSCIIFIGRYIFLPLAPSGKLFETYYTLFTCGSVAYFRSPATRRWVQWRRESLPVLFTDIFQISRILPATWKILDIFLLTKWIKV